MDNDTLTEEQVQTFLDKTKAMTEQRLAEDIDFMPEALTHICQAILATINEPGPVWRKFDTVKQLNLVALNFGYIKREQS